MTTITKTRKGDKMQYFCNGRLYRTSKRDYKYACVAFDDAGNCSIISLGNNANSTYNSMATFYSHCNLKIFEIANS